MSLGIVVPPSLLRTQNPVPKEQVILGVLWSLCVHTICGGKVVVWCKKLHCLSAELAQRGGRTFLPDTLDTLCSRRSLEAKAFSISRFGIIFFFFHDFEESRPHRGKGVVD